MVQNYGSGVQACYRGPRLYDTDVTKKLVVDQISHYKKYRELLNSDIIHLKRPDGRSWDGFMHVNPQLKNKALVMLFNPTARLIKEKVKLPLYYTGLSNEVTIIEKEKFTKKQHLNRNFEAGIEIEIPAKGYTWYVIE